MALYGSKEAVEEMLRGSTTVSLGADYSARFTGIQAAVSKILEQKIGRSFGGGVATPEARVVYAGPSGYLLFDVPPLSITEIQRYGTWDGTTYSDGTALTATDWMADPVDQDGRILGIRLAYGYTWGTNDLYGRPTAPVLVTAIWSDQANEADVPAEITYIANYVIAERYKAQMASPAGFIGPDGTVTPIRDPWRDSTVQEIIAAYRTRPVLAF